MKILVLGGTGKTGRKVAEKLQNLNLEVRIGSRSALPPFEWHDAYTWEACLDGVDAVYITFQPDLAVAGSDMLITDFTKAALAAGVKKLVLLSGRGEAEAEACEQIVAHAGIAWTVVRASWFNQNFDESFLLDSILSGQVILPVGAVEEPFIDTDDIADVAVAALTQKGHDGKIYEVTGPRLLTFAKAVEEIAKETGKHIVYQQVTIQEYESLLQAAQVPEDAIQLFKYLFTEVLDGRNAHLSHGVEEALGRKPKDFNAYVRETAATNVWG